MVRVQLRHGKHEGEDERGGLRADGKKYNLS